MNLESERSGKLSRRSFGAGMLAAGLSGLGGCAAPLGARRSYLKDFATTEGAAEPDAFWTDVMFQGVRDQKLGPPLAARVYAFGHLAGFLAVNGIEGCHYASPYPEIGIAPAGASSRAAYAAAASLAASEALQTPLAFDRMRYLKQLAEPAEAIEKGVRWGEAVGRVVQRRRTIDGGHPEKANPYLDPNYTPRRTVDSWSLTLPHFHPGVGPRVPSYERGSLPNLGNMQPFSFASKYEFPTPPFPDVRSQQFAEEFAEVYTLGAWNSTVRTEDETEIAFFWEDGPRGASVPAVWLLLGLRLMNERGYYPLLERSRLLALLSVAMCDGGVAAWHTKYDTDILRPETAIRYSADAFCNPDPRVKLDRHWRSLIVTPPFPSYVSGHSTFGGAGAEMLKLWFGTDHATFTLMPLDVVNWPTELVGVSRSFTSFTQAAEENGWSRIYGGVHWWSDHSEGDAKGRAIARHVFQSYLPMV
ncbi:MAG: vanadium-dependent haloperoxidase [Planctomycetia bacterium]|nr:vanadium-dependent haloperoxidase [Planctomycetia bacterium]